MYNCMYTIEKAEPEELDGVAPDHGPQFASLEIGDGGDAEQSEVVGEQVAQLKKHAIYRSMYMFKLIGIEWT